MKDLKDTVGALYIPSEYVAAIDRIKAKMAKKFGGVTAYKAERAWINEAGELIKEDVTVIKAFFKAADYPRATAFIIDLAVTLRGELKQDCIAIEFEGGMMLV